jgi:hypothetical protein
MALESIGGGYHGAAQCTQARLVIAMGSNYLSKVVLAKSSDPTRDCRAQIPHFAFLLAGFGNFLRPSSR